MATRQSSGVENGVPANRDLPQHGVGGVFYGGEWVELEDCAKAGYAASLRGECAACPSSSACPRSKSRNDASKHRNGVDYDVCIIGAGCVGAAIARELSKYEKLSVLWLEAADDVSQGATKGNSGIIHAGYDDEPDTNRAKYCWTGNQMFARLDEELRFGYQKNGSLVLAQNYDKDFPTLLQLKQRGEQNGVQNLQILTQHQLQQLEPAAKGVAALYSPDAGNVIPYEFTIALAENAVHNGVELRLRREVTDIQKSACGKFTIHVRRWEPQSYINARSKKRSNAILIVFSLFTILLVGVFVYFNSTLEKNLQQRRLYFSVALTLVGAAIAVFSYHFLTKAGETVSLLDKLAVDGVLPVGTGGSKITVQDMHTGGTGSWNAVSGVTYSHELVKATHVLNCAGGASDKIARMIGDTSFTIKPRLGDYLLLNRSQGYLTKSTLFPCPDPILGKGVLVQTTLWGNLILGPTARDMHKVDAASMSPTSIQRYILSKCRQLVPYFDAKETIHAFCGARAKSDRGDWIIERSYRDKHFIHVAGIDSPGLAGCPAIALEIVRMLREDLPNLDLDPNFNPHRAPIITPKPKRGLRGLKMGPIGKNDSGGTNSEEDQLKMSTNVICKCEKVTELEVVRAMRRSLPIDSTQGIRKRTRAGMGHCQADPNNYNCECRVKAIIARENRVPIEEVGGRPWPGTSTLPKRWIGEEEQKKLEEIMMSS